MHAVAGSGGDISDVHHREDAEVNLVPKKQLRGHLKFNNCQPAEKMTYIVYKRQKTKWPEKRALLKVFELLILGYSAEKVVT